MSKNKAKNPFKVRGNKIYFNFGFHGQTIRSATGFQVGQEEEAWKKYREKVKALEDIEKGIDPSHSIDEAVLRFLDEQHPNAKKGDRIFSHLKAALPYLRFKKDNADYSLPLKDIYSAANRLIVGERKRGMANSTINQRTTLLRQIATLAYEKWGWLTTPPYKKIETLTTVHLKRKMALEREEVEELASHCDSEVMRDMIIFAAYTGLRTSEIWRLHKFSLRGDSLFVDGKGHKKRTLPLHQEEIDFVEKYIPISISKDQKINAFTKARKACGLDQFNFHDLRHTFGTMLAREQKSLDRIMTLMGHSTPDQARTYINLATEEYRDDMPIRDATTQNTTQRRHSHFKIVM